MSERKTCLLQHPEGWACTRPQGHKGKHIARLSSGRWGKSWEGVAADRGAEKKEGR
jgi:hypothetical protein